MNRRAFDMCLRHDSTVLDRQHHPFRGVSSLSVQFRWSFGGNVPMCHSLITGRSRLFDGITEDRRWSK